MMSMYVIYWLSIPHRSIAAHHLFILFHFLTVYFSTVENESLQKEIDELEAAAEVPKVCDRS